MARPITAAVFDRDEAVAIALGLQLVDQGSVTGLAGAAGRALAKVVEATPEPGRGLVAALRAAAGPAGWDGPAVTAGTLTALAQACQSGQRLGFGYTDRAGDRTGRVVEPHRLVLAGHRWYLVAWDTGREDWRSFRADRVADPVPTGGQRPPRQPPGGDAAGFVRAGLAPPAGRYQVHALVRAPADEVGRVVGRWGSVELVDAGTCRLRMGVDSLEWPAMVLGVVGAEFEIVDPPELRDRVRAVGQLFARVAG